MVLGYEPLLSRWRRPSKIRKLSFWEPIFVLPVYIFKSMFLDNLRLSDEE